MSKVITLVVGLMVGFSAGHYYGQRKARTVLSVVSSTSVQPVVRPGRTVVWDGRGVSIDFPGDSPCTKAPVAFPFECVVKSDAEGIYPYKICANANCSLFIDPTIKVGTTGGMQHMELGVKKSVEEAPPPGAIYCDKSTHAVAVLPATLLARQGGEVLWEAQKTVGQNWKVTFQPSLPPPCASEITSANPVCTVPDAGKLGEYTYTVSGASCPEGSTGTFKLRVF